MKLTYCNLQENRQNHAKHRNFFENKYLILCDLCDLCGFEKFGLISPRNLRKITTKLCKTKPISEKPKLTQSLSQKQLMKKIAPSATQKTNPKQTQTKPNSERLKMDASSVLTRYYENKLVFRPQKKQSQNKPNFKKCKNGHNLSSHKGLWKCTLLEAKKKQSQIKPNRKMPAVFIFWFSFIFCRNDRAKIM